MGRIKITQQQVSSAEEIQRPTEIKDGGTSLALVFGSTAHMENSALHNRLQEYYSGAVLAGCTTAGEITAKGVEDDTITITLMQFNSTEVRTHCIEVKSMEDSQAAGAALVEGLYDDNLAYILVLSDGQVVNGSSLVRGIRNALPADIPFSGGLAGDGSRFEKTFTLDSDGIHAKSIVAVGFYGDALQVNRGSFGGWAPFGPYRKVTKSKANVVYEIDHSRALDVYSAYLGDEAKDLPASGLLFPLAISPKQGKMGLIRTLLAIDKQNGSLTFAGDVPEGSVIQLMHANYDQLIAGAENAANMCLSNGKPDVDLALLISCVGRKLMLGNNTDLEVDAVVEKFGRDATYTGFYSYGEIGPFKGSGGACELHNQTMTITTFTEL